MYLGFIPLLRLFAFLTKASTTEVVLTAVVSIRRIVDRDVTDMMMFSCVSLTIFLGGKRLKTYFLNLVI